jgi:hypothetical protein
MVLAAEISPVGYVESELEWLDTVLAAGVARQRADGRWRGEDDLRGIYVSPDLAAGVIAGRSAPGSVNGEGPTQASPLRIESDTAPLARLYERFGLDGFERFALLLALAPELDSRYRIVLGYLNDDATQGAPTVALALDLYAGAGPQSALFRRAFRPDSPLVRYRLVRLRPPALGTSLTRHALEVDDWVVARALGEDARDSVSGRSRIEQPSLPVRGWPSAHGPVVVVAEDRRAALDEARTGLGTTLLVLDLDDAAAEESLLVASRRARLDGHALALAATPLLDAGRDVLDLVETLALRVVVTADPAEADRLPDAWPRRRLAPVSLRDRRARWASALASAGVQLAPGALDDVAASHPIALDRIDAAVTRIAAEAGRQARTTADLRAAARAVARHRLGGLAGRVRSGRSWDDLVLPPQTLQQLHEIADAVAHRPRVLDEWGFAARANGRRGMHVLFSGPSGTGKTLAASVIAEESGYELYAVDLARVVDKYLGETEKHLDRIFDEASDAGAVLLFDEADALFGQRAEVHDARDRYANVEIAYLLQRLEAHEGVTILATNLGHHLDKAFARRLHHRVEFVVPDAELRRRLWRVVLPPTAPLGDDLDLDLIAERFELAGGAINNAALTAAYLAAAAGRPIALQEVVRAVARELEKSGNAATRAEFRDLYDLLPEP